MNRFDAGVDRLGTHCLKWDMMSKIFGREDLIPLWVADMDFAAPDEVIRAIQERAAHGAFGYSGYDERDNQAVVGWMKRRHGVDVAPDAVIASPGVVDSMNVAVAAFTEKGDKVVVPTPVYPAFYGSTNAAGCEIRRSPLIFKDGNWYMDFDDMEKALKDGAKAVLLCNPHNPVGRVWTKEELKTVSDLTRRYGAVLIADEIHADLELPGHKNTSILAVDDQAIALVSGTKTFNMAALRHSSVLIPDKDRREAFKKEFSARGINGINLFGVLAQRVAYETGDKWLDELLEYLDGTRVMVEAFIKDRLPMLSVSPLMATYLMWLDMKALGLEQKELARFMIEKAGCAMVSGTDFGPEGEGYMRMNIATPRRNVERALIQLEKAIKERD